MHWPSVVGAVHQAAMHQQESPRATENVVIIAKDLQSHMGSRDYRECCGRRLSHVGTGALQREEDQVQRGLGRCDRLQSKTSGQCFIDREQQCGQHSQTLFVTAHRFEDVKLDLRQINIERSSLKHECRGCNVAEPKASPSAYTAVLATMKQKKREKKKRVQSRGRDSCRQSNDSSVLSNKISVSRFHLATNPRALGCRAASLCRTAS